MTRFEFVDNAGQQNFNTQLFSEGQRNKMVINPPIPLSLVHL